VPSPGVRDSIVGYDGTVFGVAVRGSEFAEDPLAFVATTVTVYSVPFVSPEVIVHVVAEPPALHVAVFDSASVAVAVYPVIAVPLFEPADHVTAIEALPAIALTNVGAPGTTLGVTAIGLVGVPLPFSFAATIVTEYSTPFVSPVMVHPVPVSSVLQ
jgi:hypothetical protein